MITHNVSPFLWILIISGYEWISPRMDFTIAAFVNQISIISVIISVIISGYS